MGNWGYCSPLSPIICVCQNGNSIFLISCLIISEENTNRYFFFNFHWIVSLLIFCGFYVLFLPFTKVESQIDQLQKRFLREKLWNEIGLRITKFCSQMVENLCTGEKLFLGLCHSLLMDQSRSVKISSSIKLCIVGELAGGGSVAVAVGVSDRWQVTPNMWHLTCETFLLLLYQCYYRQTWRDSVSPVCKISNIGLGW